MPRSRVPAIYPTIQLFLHAITASLEIAMLSMLIILSMRKANYPVVYAAVRSLSIASFLNHPQLARNILDFNSQFSNPNFLHEHSETNRPKHQIMNRL